MINVMWLRSLISSNELENQRRELSTTHIGTSSDKSANQALDGVYWTTITDSNNIVVYHSRLNCFTRVILLDYNQKANLFL